MNPHSRINCYANKKRYNFTRVIKGDNKSAFDIGCGSGFFLAYLRNNGWQVAGIDSAPEHVEYAQQTLGLTDVITAQWPGYNPACKNYDLVSLIHVLEHLPDPVDGLRAAAAMLKPGGYLLTETPNVNAWARYVYRGRCNMFDAPRHLCLFSQATFRKCAVAAGLKTVKMITYSPSLDGYIESLRYLLQDINIRKYDDKNAHRIAASGNVAEKMRSNKAFSIKHKIIASAHSVERFVDRSIDYIASSTGGGLTLLSLIQKEMK
jgi:SAM-dependent methyltransferase